MNLIAITEESGGTVKKDDIIIKIGDDDLTGWTLMRGFFNFYCLLRAINLSHRS